MKVLREFLSDTIREFFKEPEVRRAVRRISSGREVLPNMTKAERDALVSPTEGQTIFQTDNTPGLRVYNGTNWMKFTEATD